MHAYSQKYTSRCSTIYIEYENQEENIFRQGEGGNWDLFRCGVRVGLESRLITAKTVLNNYTIPSSKWGLKSPAVYSIQKCI